MGLIRTITAQDLKDAMKECGRDYYSIESCEKIVEYYEEFTESNSIELDPIAIACEWNEEHLDYILEQYDYIDDFDDIDKTDINEVVDVLNNYTYAVITTSDDGFENILYREF